jgi:HK97 family phage prohead protease
MPLPNFHTCRIRDPADFVDGSIRTMEADAGGKPILILIGRARGSTTTETQSVRYPVKSWDADDARGHCSAHAGTFEAAEGAVQDVGEGDDGPGAGGLFPTLQPQDTGFDKFPPIGTGRATRFTPGPVEIEVQARGGGADQVRVIRGYAAVFYDGTPDTEFRLARDLVERIRPGAFDRALDGTDDVVALFNHDPNLVLGRQSAGTLQLRADGRGIPYTITPPRTSVADDLVENLRLRNVTGSSFSFLPTKETWARDNARGLDVREILEVETFDVGPVTFAAYKATEAEVNAARAACRACGGGMKQRLAIIQARARMLPD